MKLRLTNGYPYPFPSHLSPDEQEAINEGAASNELTFYGVIHFEWKHTVTVEFRDYAAYDRAKEQAPDWTIWSSNVLEAGTSLGDGYDHPAIVVGDMAYCGFILTEDAA